MFLMFLDGLFEILLLWINQLCVSYWSFSQQHVYLLLEDQCSSQPASCICKHWASMIVTAPAGQCLAMTQMRKCPPCVHSEQWSLPPLQSQQPAILVFDLGDLRRKVCIFIGLLHILNHHLLIMQNWLNPGSKYMKYRFFFLWLI